MADSGLDVSVLSEFCSRLAMGDAEALLLDMLLALCRERKLLVSRGWQRTDSTHVLGAGRSPAISSRRPKLAGCIVVVQVAQCCSELCRGEYASRLGIPAFQSS